MSDGLMSDGLVINQTQKKAVLLMVICTLFTSLGQIFWKLGLVKMDFSSLITLFNLHFILGFLSYGIGTILMLLAFQKGELSILYPIAATSYVWVSLVSPLLFPTDFMNGWKWLGIIIILFSVSLLGYSSSRKPKVLSHG